LQRWLGVILQPHRWFFCLKVELRRTSYTETVVGCSLIRFPGRLVNDILVGLLVAMSIIYVPTESFKEWVKELTPQFGFVVAIGAKIQFVPLKVFN
jgi:hypothetical protein